MLDLGFTLGLCTRWWCIRARDVHLCDVVKGTLKQVEAQVEGEAKFQWRVVDIDADPELRRKYNDEVPVVFIDGRKAFKYHMGAPEFPPSAGGSSVDRWGRGRDSK